MYLYVRNGPIIYTGNEITGVRNRPADKNWGNPDTAKNSPQVLENLEKKGELLIRDLCQKGKDSIDHMHVVKTDVSYYL